MAVLAQWGKQQLWFLVSTELPLSLPGTRLSCERTAHSVAQSSTSHKMKQITELLSELVELVSIQLPRVYANLFVHIR